MKKIRIPALQKQLFVQSEFTNYSKTTAHTLLSIHQQRFFYRITFLIPV